MNYFSEIEDFCDYQFYWLREWIKMPNGVPRAQTFSNISAIIEPAHFKRCVAVHVIDLNPTLKRKIIVIDGMRLRGSYGLDIKACYVVSAWVAESGLTLAQEYMANKSYEITAILHLIEVLALAGQIVMLDAMGTHAHIAHRNFDIQYSEDWSYDQRIERSNARMVTRTVTVKHRLDWMDHGIRGKWYDLCNLIHVETQRT